jgi:hypothetical protein
MTGRERPMTEIELDRILDAWFDEGAHGAPDRIAESAMAEIATVPQERGWTAVLRSSISNAPLAWAAALLALVVGLGILIGPRLVGDEPTPVPSPSSVPSGMVLVSSPEDGYEVLVPTHWEEVDSGYEDSRKWSGSDGEFMVSYGTSIIEGAGEVTLCFPPLPDYVTCLAAEYGYSIPLSPEDTQPASLEASLDRCDGGCPVTSTETTLDREPAIRDRLVVTDLQLTYVSAFHLYRPIILYWSEPLDVADEARVEFMRESFRFLDTGAPPPEDPTEQVLYANADDGYEILLPRSWVDGAAELLDPTGSPYPGVTAFGAGAGFGTRGSPGLTISVGQSAGSVLANCVPPETEGPDYGDPVCQPLTATTLDELGTVLISVPLVFAESGQPDMPVEVQNDLTLSGEPGREERPTYSGSGANCLGCPGVLYHAFLFHSGTPVVLAFDFWTVEFEEMSPAYLTDVLESFRLLD